MGTQLSKKVTFVICTENGILESRSLVLCSSLRKFGGRFKDAPVLSYSPRVGKRPHLQTLKALEKLNVTPILKNLNKKYLEYPVANKILAAADAEANVKSDFLVFLDSDMVMVNEPTELLMKCGNQVALVPAWDKCASSTGPDDPNDAYWMELYSFLNVKEEIFINPSVHAPRPIRAYWNSGMISARCESGVFTKWLENFEKCWARKLFPRLAYHMDEATLAGTLLSQFPRQIQELPRSYNFPMCQYRNKSGLRSMNEAVLLHYYKLLGRNLLQVREYFKMWFPRAITSEKELWLREQFRQMVWQSVK